MPMVRACAIMHMGSAMTVMLEVNLKNCLAFFFCLTGKLGSDEEIHCVQNMLVEKVPTP